jgi:DNA-binding CsgD family transcriptional regulator
MLHKKVHERVTPTGKTMSEEKEADRSRRKKRRGQLDREKETRRAEQSRTASHAAKTSDQKAKLDLRITKLIDQGYSPESVGKRLGLSIRRIKSAIDSNRRS